MVKNLTASAADAGSVPALGRYSVVGNGNLLQYPYLQNSILCTEFTLTGEGNGNPLQYSCLENPMDRGTSWAWSRIESDTTERLHFCFLNLLAPY